VDEQRLFPFIDKLAEHANTRVQIVSGVLSGPWEQVERNQADLIIAPNTGTVVSDIQTRDLYEESLVYCASPEHPIHSESSPLDPETLSKYRAIAIADSAVEKPKLEVRLFDNQPRLTVSHLSLKIDAISRGLGIGSLPFSRVSQLIDSGVLKTIGDGQPHTVTIQLAWKNHQMGQAKQWFMRNITERFQIKK